MKRILLLFISIFIVILCNGKTIHIYKTQNQYRSNIIATWDGTRLYHGSDTYYSSIMLTVKGGYIYDGPNTYNSNIILSYSDTRLYSGSTKYYSNIIFTYSNGYIYDGSNTYSSNKLIKIFSNKVYDKNGYNCILSADGYVPWYIWVLFL